MFVVYAHSDSIRIPPAELRKDVSSMLADEIDVKYANRVLPGVGLVISLFAVDTIQESIIYPGDGGATTHGAESEDQWAILYVVRESTRRVAAYTRRKSWLVCGASTPLSRRAWPHRHPLSVSFRLLVFRPSSGEVMQGKVKAQDEHRGITVG